MEAHPGGGARLRRAVGWVTELDIFAHPAYRAFQTLDKICRSSGFSDLNVVTLEANLVDGDGIVGHPTFLGLAGFHIERSEVPWAGDDVALKLTVGERTALMRARIAKREVDPINVGDDHLFTVDIDQFHFPGSPRGQKTHAAF